MDRLFTRANALAPSTLRRLMMPSATSSATRNHGYNFVYPHSGRGTNNAYNNLPVNEVEADRNMKVGDKAPLAHQDVRKFPDWYKPYTFNYNGDGYMALFFGVMCLFGYSYLNDICEQKGRRSRKIFSNDHLKTDS